MIRGVTLAAVLLAGLFAPAGAYAHAQLEWSSPERGAVLQRAPATVTFEFSEPVEGNFGAVRVYDARGNRVDRGASFHPGNTGDKLAARVRAGLGNGSYTAIYRVVSADSHVVSGGSVFSVGRAGAVGRTVNELLADQRAGKVTSTAFTIARAVQYAAIGVAAGALMALLWLFPGEAGRGGRLMRVAIVAGALSAVAMLGLEAAQASGESLWSASTPATLGDVIGTRFGVVWTIGLGAWLGIGLIAALRRTWLPAVAGVAYLVAAPALSGHAAVRDSVLLLPANVLHVAAMAIWLGGLLALLFVAPRGRRPDTAIASFSDVALRAVVVLLVSGVLQAVVQIREFDLLLDTAYGRAVLIKLGLLLALIWLGAVNRRRGVRRATLRAEVAIIAVVLVVSGALAGYAPARDAATGPYAASAKIGPQRADITVDPARTGPNVVHLYLTDPRTGDPVDSAKEVRITAVHDGGDVARIGADATKSGPGHYTSSGLALPVAGRWKLVVEARVSEFDEYSHDFSFEAR